MRPLTSDYRERVYAGVLGKIIGVYLGRPFEQWRHEAIEERLGEIRGYVHEKLNVPLIVSDDDISGTFTFLRALEEHGYSADIAPSQIGDTWLNSIIEGKSILWWGGMGTSTEHTAFIRLKSGYRAPESGCIVLNGQVVAEQIGAQIFIDGWGLICPADPEKAADFARRAGSVSHDGEAIYGAQSVAAMVAQAFVETDVNRLMDVATSVIPPDCLIRNVIDDVREWREQDGDWRKSLVRLEQKWGYSVYPGGCHMIPNHAVIILALAYGQGDFDESMCVVNTAGYDTDCNSGNVGCILGVAGGLAGLAHGVDWRGPVADRMYVPTADAGRVITDAVRETDAIVAIAHKVRGEAVELPKERFHFSLPGSVQGFQSDDATVFHRDACLGIRVDAGKSATISTPTWLPPDARGGGGYSTMASPTLYLGQTVRAVFGSVSGATHVQLVAKAILPDGSVDELLSEPLAPGQSALEWTLEYEEPVVIESVGLRVQSGSDPAEVAVESVDWTGVPRTRLSAAGGNGLFTRQFVHACDSFYTWGGPSTLVNNVGRGHAIVGCREWANYRLKTSGIAHLADSFGVAVLVQGLQRFAAVEVLRNGDARILYRRDGEERVLAQAPAGVGLSVLTSFDVTVTGNRIAALIGGARLEATVPGVHSGQVSWTVSDGKADFHPLEIEPA
jgi:ADP-ribosylglycohydrolase